MTAIVAYWALAVVAQTPEEKGPTPPLLSPGEVPMTIKMTSPAFEPGTAIPKKHTED